MPHSVYCSVVKCSAAKAEVYMYRHSRSKNLLQDIDKAVCHIGRKKQEMPAVCVEGFNQNIFSNT